MSKPFEGEIHVDIRDSQPGWTPFEPPRAPDGAPTVVFVGLPDQKVASPEEIPTGENLILSASFDKDGEDPPGVSTGSLSLFHGEQKVAEQRIKTQPAAFGLSAMIARE